jgi:hypothetical protein
MAFRGREAAALCPPWPALGHHPHTFANSPSTNSFTACNTGHRRGARLKSTIMEQMVTSPPCPSAQRQRAKGKCGRPTARRSVRTTGATSERSASSNAVVLLGFEPRSPALQTVVLPLNYRTISTTGALLANTTSSSLLRTLNGRGLPSTTRRCAVRLAYSALSSSVLCCLVGASRRRATACSRLLDEHSGTQALTAASTHHTRPSMR